MLNLKTLLAYSMEALNTGFKLENKPIDCETVLENPVLFSSIMKRADQLCSFCLGTNLNMQFNKDSNHNITVEFNEQSSYALILLCAIEIIIEMIETAPDTNNVNLDDLLYD